MRLRVPARFIVALLVAALAIGVVSWLVSSQPESLSWPVAFPGVPPIRPAVDLPWPHRVILLGDQMFVPVRPFLLESGAMVALAAALAVVGRHASRRGAEPLSTAHCWVVVLVGLLGSAIIVGVVATPPDLLSTIMVVPALFLMAMVMWTIAAGLASLLGRRDRSS